MKQEQATRIAYLEAQFKEHHQSLCGYARNLMNPKFSARFDPEDIVQKAYAEATTRLQTFNPDDFVGFMKAEVHRRMIDEARKHENLKRGVRFEREVDQCSGQFDIGGPLANPITTPSSVAVRRENEEALRLAMLLLDEQERYVIHSKYIATPRKSSAEIGEALGISAAAVDEIHRRAKTKLAKFLNEVGIE